MRRAALLVLATAFALSGCGAPEETETGSGSVPEEAFGEGAVAVESDVPYAYDDGLSVIITGPREYTPAADAAPADPPPVLAIFTVRVENETDGKYEVGDIEARLQSAGEDQEEYRNPDYGLEGVPESYELLPGGARQFQLVYGAQSLDDVALLISPGGGRDALLLVP
jgi:hypothetical protein